MIFGKRFFCLLTVLLFAAAAGAGDWEELDPATHPEARYGLTMVTLGEEIYLFGGSSDDFATKYNDLWRWDCESSSWQQVAAGNPPPSRYYHGAAAVGGKLYIGYGLGDGGLLGDLWAFDPATESWTELVVAGGPVPHYLGSMGGLADGRIFVAGGYDTSSDVLIDAYILDPNPGKSGVAAQHIESLRDPRYGAVVASTACGLPMLIGGWVTGKAGGPSSQVLLWTPEPEPWGEWLEITPQGEPVLARALAAGAQWLGQDKRGGKSKWGDVIIIVGGESTDKAAQTADVQYYDIASNTWWYGDPAPEAMSSHGAAVIPPSCGFAGDTAQVMTFGGFTDDGVSDRTYHHDSDAEVTTGSDLVITAAAHAGGVGSTMWVTDLEVYNGDAVTATCTVHLLRKGRDNTSRPSMSFELGPRQAQRLPDVLLDRFAFEGTGALLLRSEGAEVTVTSRTYNLLGAGNPEGLPAGATFGQFIPGVPQDEALGFGDEARLIQLSRANDPGRGFRTNVGFVNLVAEEIEIEVDLYNGEGGVLGSVPVSLQPFEYDQITDIYDRVNAADVSDGFAVVRTTSEGGRFLCYASVVDNRTGDPTYVAPQSALGAGGGVIPAAAQAPGLGGTQWRTDLVLHNPSDRQVMGGVFLLPRDQANPDPLVEVLAVPAGQSLAMGEVLDRLFGFEGAAALRFGNALAQLMVTSRTYNLLGAGNPLGYPAGSTFGQFIAAVPDGSRTAFGEDALLIQLSRSADPESGFRSNLGVLNGGGDSIAVEIDLYRADGTLLGTLTEELGAWESRQWTDAFAEVAAGDLADAYALVRTTTPGGSFVCYASVVDNITGDPIYIPGM